MAKRISAEAARELVTLAASGKARRDFRKVRALSQPASLPDYLRTLDAWRKAFPRRAPQWTPPAEVKMIL